MVAEEVLVAGNRPRTVAVHKVATFNSKFRQTTRRSVVVRKHRGLQIYSQRAIGDDLPATYGRPEGTQKLCHRQKGAWEKDHVWRGKMVNLYHMSCRLAWLTCGNLVMHVNVSSLKDSCILYAIKTGTMRRIKSPLQLSHVDNPQLKNYIKL